jgi:hypothetical protein
MSTSIVLMCVDCVLASLKVTQADPGRRTPPRGGSITTWPRMQTHLGHPLLERLDPATKKCP